MNVTGPAINLSIVDVVVFNANESSLRRERNWWAASLSAQLRKGLGATAEEAEEQQDH